MKRFILITTFFTAAYTCFGQTCSKNNAIFRQDNSGTPKDVYTLGSNPEFRFLRNMSSPEQVAAAIRRGNQRGAAELNNMLMDIGFANGAKDVTASSVAEHYIPNGTMGNMGDGNYSTSYVKLMAGDGRGVRSWKITSPTGCELYILSACGNAFYPTNQPARTTACLNVPLNLSSTTKEVTLESGTVKTTANDVYIYYVRKRDNKDPLPARFADVPNAARASEPLLLDQSDKVEAVPQTYKVTVSAIDNNVKVCEDKPLDVATNINVEKTSSYAGYYPTVNKNQYKEVSKRVYRKVARKMCKVNRKEAEITSLTGVEVHSCSTTVAK